MQEGRHPIVLQFAFTHQVMNEHVVVSLSHPGALEVESEGLATADPAFSLAAGFRDYT